MIRDAPDTIFAGYPAKSKAAYRIYGTGKGRIPNTGYPAGYFGKISNKFMKTVLTILDFCSHKIKHDLVTKLMFVQIFFLGLFEEK
jgi:hypothetical protein